MFDRRLATALMVPVAAVSLAGCGINSVPTRQEEAKQAWANVQAAYQARADLIPQLVGTVRGAARIEEETLTNVINARARATQVTVNADQLSDPAAVARFREAQGNVSSSLSRLLVTVEQYPQLQSQGRFADLQSQLEGTQNRITIAIRDYNEAVRRYNTTIRTFPDAIGAKVIHGAQPMQPYEAVSPNAQNAPTVDFGVK